MLATRARNVKKMMTNLPVDSNTSDELIRQFIFDYNINTTALGMNEEKAINEAIRSISALIDRARVAELQQIPRTRSKQAYIENRIAELQTNQTKKEA